MTFTKITVVERVYFESLTPGDPSRANLRIEHEPVGGGRVLSRQQHRVNLGVGDSVAITREVDLVPEDATECDAGLDHSPNPRAKMQAAPEATIPYVWLLGQHNAMVDEIQALSGALYRLGGDPDEVVKR